MVNKITMIIWYTIVFTIVIILVILGLKLLIPDKQTHWKLKFCEIAEFSPDFTPQEKQNCRIMRSNK
jgi:hypothetical protein